ncbi:MAG: hypothetical protein CMM08_09060 [Rhodospirillaceae bacterium]|jgi:hemerythrin-like domain-containing protein|nr:hypothetical protein [Rhodospirillaceae bacterium]
MPARYVKPYVKRNKNDAADAEAICEAVTRPCVYRDRFSLDHRQGCHPVLSIIIGIIDEEGGAAIMKLTNALLGEHAVIYELFEYVRETIQKSDDIRDIHGAAAVLERLVVWHARIEEDLLFPRLEPHLGQMGPLAVMRAEHRQIDDLLEAAKQETNITALRSVIGKFLDLAYGHFQKEEQVLFGMARQHLDEATLTELGDQWAASRSVTVTR